MKKNFILCSMLIAGVLLLWGCEKVQINETGEPEQVIESAVTVINDDLNEQNNAVEEEIEAIEEKTIIIEPDNSYIFEDLCKVCEEYDESLVGAPIETIVKNLRKESYERMVLLSHEVKDDTDTVKYKVIPQNISGKGQQYIVCYAEFIKEGDEWCLSSKKWSEWVIKRNELNGSNWVADAENVQELAKLFDGGLSFEDGSTVYVHFKKNLNIITVLLNDDASVFETKIGVNFGGTVYYINDDEKKTVDFTCLEGIVNDDGILSFKLVTDNGEEFFSPGNKNSFISEALFNLVMSDENIDFKNAAVLDNLDTFEVKSDSIFYGEWIKETGAKNGNVSPELSWDKVDGASTYAIMIIDLDEGNYHLHGYGTSDTNHIDMGTLDEFVGPYPPSPHNYTAYVFALKNAVDPGLRVDKQNSDAESLFELLNKENPDNVISYGQVTASFEYLERVW